MNCDVVQNRLLALPDPRRTPDDLRGHLDGCPACRAFQGQAGRLDGLLAAVPVPPPSDEAKAALLDRVTEAGPIIRRVPVVTRRDSALDLPAYLAERGRWVYAAAVAAAVLLAVGWLTFRGGGPPVEPPYDGVAGHGLLRKVVGKVATDSDALARVETPEQRMQAWAAVTGDLRDEVQRIYRHAGRDDLTALAGLFEKAAERGLLPQAEQVARDRLHLPAELRLALFRDAIDRMARVEADAAAFAQTAPEDKKPPLHQIRQTARKVREELSRLEPRHAGDPPGKGA
jgi:hypothetical protein